MNTIENKPRSMEKIEKENSKFNSIQLVEEYIEDIYTSLKEEEKLNRNFTNIDYMQEQKDINEQMRAILIDWLIEVHLKFRLVDETLFLTVSIIDRYLSKQIIHRSNLQLLGITAMFIACKHEEIITPHIKDFVYITDKAYSKEQVIEMEREIMNVLQFDLLVPSNNRFYEIIAHFFNFDKKEFLFGRYLMESFLIDYKSTKYLSSLIACTCSYIVMKFFKFKNYQAIYSSFFNSNSNSTLLKECAKEICFLIDNFQNSNLTSTKRKYARKECYQVSMISFS
jgi:hypothetical protein